jgi:hypothetical protein
MSQTDEILGGGHRPLEVLRVDRRQQRDAGVGVDGHHRGGAGNVDHCGRDEESPVGQGAAETGQVPTFPTDLVPNVTTT